MLLLETSFVTNADKMGDMTFTQVKSQTTPTLTVYIYRRDNLDGSFFKYEVFMAKRRYKGQQLPGGLVEECDREQYPRANSFGFTAWETNTIQRAEQIFNNLVKELVDKSAVPVDDGEEVSAEVVSTEPKQRGRKRIERPDMVYPTGNWTMKDLLKVNPEWNQPLCYQKLTVDRKAGLVVEVARLKVEGAKGKPQVSYKVV